MRGVVCSARAAARRNRVLTTEQRFWAKVERPTDDGCWPWTACLNRGYGQFCVGGGRRVCAHRFSYELLGGPIPDGLTIDHLCRVKHCVNPAHLEPVTARENTRRGRKTHCKRGHEFTTENTFRSAKGRECRQCRKMLTLRWERSAAGRASRAQGRGKCSVCGFSFRLLKDGTVQTHRLWIGPHRLAPCDGSRQPAASSLVAPTANKEQA